MVVEPATTFSLTMRESRYWDPSASPDVGCCSSWPSVRLRAAFNRISCDAGRHHLAAFRGTINIVSGGRLGGPISGARFTRAGRREQRCPGDERLIGSLYVYQPGRGQLHDARRGERLRQRGSRFSNCPVTSRSTSHSAKPARRRDADFSEPGAPMADFQGASSPSRSAAHRRLTPDGKQLDQNQTRNEATDVCHERHATARLRTCPDHAKRTDQLEHKPQPDRHKRGHRPSTFGT